MIFKKNKDNRVVVPNQFIKKVTILGCTGTILIATLGLLGYVPGLRILGSARPDYYPMAPSTGISFLLLGIILVLYVQNFYQKRIRLYTIILSALVSIFGFLKYIEYFAGVETSFEEAIITISSKLGEIPMGIMSPSTGALFFLSGITIILLIHQTTRKEQNIFFGHSAGILGSLVFISSLIFTLSYLYGQPFLYDTGKIVPMAITTATAFLFLGGALISAVGAKYVPLSFFAGSSTRSRLLRIFVPLIIFVVLIQNIIILLMRDIFKMHDALLTALFIVIFTTLVAFVVIRAGYIVGNTIDKVKEKLHAEITERKKAIEEIEKLAKFPTENPNPVLRISKDGTVLYHNYASESLLEHWHHKEGKPLQDRWFQFVLDALKDDDIKTVETEISDKIISLTFAPIVEKGFVNVYGLDITERKRAEEELIKHRKHLEELVKERTTELEAFAYSVSHDLRGPLRAIIGFTRILMEDYVEKLDAEGKRLGGIIQQNTKKMGQLIDDLLAFSRAGRASMSFSEIDMKEMANAIYHEATNAEVRKRITFTIADLSKAEGDTNMMRQVWMNFISNAIKFSAHRKQAVISVSCQEEENKLIYYIKDNGAGFNMKYKDKLFGVFQRLHSEKEFEGTGVGLALVQRIIYRHNGEVWANGEVDNGAAFYFSLPKNRRI